ncbi:MAG: hypothetical protein JWR57_1333 [Mycetocola sp.]|nr:hypothetical protein [Mycetocola sp.]
MWCHNSEVANAAAVSGHDTGGWEGDHILEFGRTMLGDEAVAFLRTAPEGTRVVVRHQLPDGQATDALGWFLRADDTHCAVATKRGLETIAFTAVIAAKEVPPPPPPRERRRPATLIE